MARRKEGGHGGGHGWFVTFADLMGLLVAFFVMLVGFLFAILSGLIGTPVGNRNFGIVFVWIAWWALLILIAVPLLGRGWCSICPIPLP